jgi:hypothetical protein
MYGSKGVMEIAGWRGKLIFFSKNAFFSLPRTKFPFKAYKVFA